MNFFDNFQSHIGIFMGNLFFVSNIENGPGGRTLINVSDPSHVERKTFFPTTKQTLSQECVKMGPK